MNIYRRQALIDSGRISPEDAWLHFWSLATGGLLTLRCNFIFWNTCRKRWIVIAQRDVGEIWYAEGDTPVGP